MRMDHTQRGWALGSLALLGVIVIAYVIYVLQSPTGPSGGSFIGMGVRITGFAFMLFRCAARREETRSDLESRPRASLDARPSVARPLEPADDFVTRWIPFWRHADARVDLADDHHRWQRLSTGADPPGIMCLA